MKKAIQFGAGNIGRGFIGAVLEKAGYHVVFADVNEQIVDRINRDKGYTVQIMDTVCEEVRITDISAVDSRSPELAQQIAEAEIVTTAVGLTILPRIAGAIAAGIEARREQGVEQPLNVIACENGVRATSQLKAAVLTHLDAAGQAYCEQYVGFPDCSVDRIVPPVKSENPIDVVVERFFEWNVERAAFKGAVPEIPGMNPADNLIAYIERKLFTLNTGHAITAYLGRMKGYMTICQSISDEQIHAVVLVKAHVLGIHRPLEDVRAHLVGALERFALLKAELGEHGGLVARVHDRLLRVVREVDVLDGRQVFRPAFHDAQDALHAPVGDEAQCGSHDKEGPFRAMGALFALFSPYLHDSIILAYR